MPPLAVNLIGRGRIGGPVADWIAASAAYRLNAILGRDGCGVSPAPLIIDTAGPGALTALGADCLAQGEVWSVGAAALLDDDLRARLEGVSRRHGHRLRLFTPWIAGPALCPPGTPARLHVIQSAPGLAPQPGLMFDGPLAEAARAYPHHLNTATAAALTGPGIAATTVALHSTLPGGSHRIQARFDMPGQVIETDVIFGETFGGGPHPVAQALIAALARRAEWLSMG